MIRQYVEFIVGLGSCSKLMIVFQALHEWNSRMTKRHLPSFPSLRAFESAARHLSFKAAAEELCVTQSAISHQIKVLEEFLEAPLFIRHPQRVELTLRGSEYLEMVSHLLDGLETATQRIMGGSYQGPLHIVASPAFASVWLLPRLLRFNKIYPDIEVRLTTIAANDTNGSTDFDVRVNCAWEVPPDKGGEPMMRSPHVLVCSPKLIENGAEINCIDDILQYPILREDGGWDCWERWLTAAGYNEIPPLNGPRFENTYMSLRAAEEGLGISLQPIAFITEKVELGKLIVLNQEEHIWALYFTLSCAENWQQQPRILAFREWLNRELGRCSGLELLPQKNRAGATA